MNKKDLIASFQDTIQFYNSDFMRSRTKMAIASSTVYPENFNSKKQKENKSVDIWVESGTTFEVARRLCGAGKVAVLNFANPHFPGGGVQKGAMAQEECLCRSSNLYACLSASHVYKDYYEYHRKKCNRFFSDRVIYSQGVIIFKDDADIPNLLPEEAWREVDVITCAAPYIVEENFVNKSIFINVFKSRIKNIFEVALENDIDVLVLGAFGCGAFKNPPDMVAKAFHQVIDENNYACMFEKIVFAIKSTAMEDKECPNIKAFQAEFRKYYKHIEQNLYPKQKFSILGDSISTLQGYNPKNYNVFYNENTCMLFRVGKADDTWWGKVIEHFGGELLVNNSLSGSRVTKLSGNEELFPSGCSDERTSFLHINSVMPDVIIVYLGTNDWANGVKTGDETRFLGEDDYEIFDYAYDEMLKRLKHNYPNSMIWCCTLCETYISSHPDFKFPHSYAGKHIEEYNDIIRQKSQQNRCNLIDLYSYGIPYDSEDGSHPNVMGMSTLAEIMIREMEGKVNSENKIGTWIAERYQLLKQFSGDGICEKYLSFDERTNKALVTKICNKENKQIFCDKLVKEAYALKPLAHPAIPKVIDFGETESYVYAVYEYTEGRTLEDIIRVEGPQSVDAVIDWGKQLCDVLDYLHSRQPIHLHRDIRPLNIMCMPDQRLRIVDFELMQSQKTQDTMDLDIRGYTAPEVFGGMRQVDARADIYSLGATLYRLVTGCDPHEPPYEIVPICRINPELPKGLEYIIAKCTEIDRAKRYKSCIELLEDLENYTELPKKEGFFKRIFKRYEQ